MYSITNMVITDINMFYFCKIYKKWSSCLFIYYTLTHNVISVFLIFLPCTGNTYLHFLEVLSPITTGRRLHESVFPLRVSKLPINTKECNSSYVCFRDLSLTHGRHVHYISENTYSIKCSDFNIIKIFFFS